ncbi:MAG: alpha/beta hydrolase [Verrucomicrobia bacterium]|nr:alpha/beta hydrolase [Verrucomicrobiota bacterium]
MLRWSLLFLALATLVLALLTVVKSPDWSEWKLALLAGEFGHWLALLPLVIGTLAWVFRGPSTAPAVATALLCALAFGLFTRPSLEAWRLAGGLPGKLTRQFGPVTIDRTPFSLSRLFSRSPTPVPSETLVYAGDLSLDFYRALGRDRAPCIVLIHGGGWDRGSRTELAHFNHWLAGLGYAVAAIDYRLAPKSPWPAQRDDTLAAIAYLKSHAAHLGLDPARFVLLGRSAGGNIAEAVGYTAGDPAIRGVIALYAPADLHFAWQYSREDDVLKSPQLMRQFLGGTPETARALYDSASGYLHVSSSTPPTLLIHGQLDTLVWHRQSERLDARLTENRVPHVFVSLPWATHAFEYNLAGPGGQLTTYAVEWFLAATTR